VLLRTSDDRLEPVVPHPGVQLKTLDVAAAQVEPFVRGGAIPVGSGDLPESLAALAVLDPELIVTMQGHDERLEGVLILGPRLSDEPYGREDRELVASVASQAGTALQNLRLASTIAERLEAERRVERELEIAREVQANLLPHHRPAIPSLDYAGKCIQARQVGGDYYDYLYLGPGRLGLVLADISGKGIGAALLMASLQASLRGEYSRAPDDLPHVLHSLNRSFFDSTAPNLYATLFFATYDEPSRRRCYANCGHVPPIVVAGNGAIERLLPTGPVIGLFEEWSCTTGEITLHPGDTLVIFSDGVVEAFNAAGEEFGEERLTELLRVQAGRSAALLIDDVVSAVRSHSGQVQSDDVTLLVARARNVDATATL
jgi:serine phosphatase RsbU (regulator of sigma subunit)